MVLLMEVDLSTTFGRSRVQLIGAGYPSTKLGKSQVPLMGTGTASTWYLNCG